MKHLTISTLILAALAIAPLTADARGPQGGQSGACHQALTDRLANLPSSPLSASDEAALLHLREEEKLARDVYTTLASQWTVPTFANIARAEQRHMDLMAVLLERYGITDPVQDQSVGTFSDPDLSALYQSLVTAGQTSLGEALTVGATIEDLDLADLSQLLAETDSPDIVLVANNLAKGSRNHLRAFARALETNGFGPYTAQHLTQTEVDEILASARERGVVYDENGDALVSGGGRGRGRGGAWHRGHGRGGGQGNGQGQGRGQGGGPRDGSCMGRAPQGN